MTSQPIKGLSGTEGLFTFNFFCESLISALNTLEHLLEHEQAALPDKALELPQTLASIGENLLQDYNKNQLSLNRFKCEILNFYNLAFSAHDDMTPIIHNGSNELQYYYYVYMQGLSLFFPNMLQSIQNDLPDNDNARAFLNETSDEFSALLHPMHRH